MMEKISPAHKIDLSNPQKFPEFYQAKYSFDDMHLNHEGSIHYTQSLADALKTIMQDQNIHHSIK